MVDKKKTKKEMPCVKCIKKAIEQINAKKKKAKKKTKPALKKTMPLQFVFPHLVSAPIPVASIPVAPSLTRALPLKITSETQTDKPKFASFETQTDTMGERGVPIRPTFSSFETQTDRPTFSSFETQTDIMGERGVPVRPTFKNKGSQYIEPFDEFDVIEESNITNIEQDKPKRQRKTKEETNTNLRERYFQKYGFYPPIDSSNNSMKKALQKKGKPILKDI